MLTSASLTLALGATGKTGARVASTLLSRGLPVRRHVTYLSAYGTGSAAPKTAMRRVELDLLSRPGLTHAILRPAWFMQNFSETFLKPFGGTIAVPAGDGAEAFVDAEDIAAVASATLADPQAHAGAQYELTGPEALTIAEAAKIISDVSGQAVDYTDIDRDEWVAGAVAGGVPAEYGAALMVLTETIASGRGSRPNNDIEKATGARPTTFADFARRTAAAWAVAEAQ